MHLLDVLLQLALRKRLIAWVTGVAIVTGALLCLLLPVKYSATTKLMPPQQSPSAASLLVHQLIGGGASSLAAMAGGGLGLKNPNDIYVGLLESRPIADAIIHKFDLTKTYHSKNMTAARKKLAKNTEITSEKSGFISIAVTDEDKSRVAEMANAYTAQFRALTMTIAITEASRRALFYEDQLKQAKDALVVAENNFQMVQQKKGVVQPAAQTRAMIASITALRAQVAAKQVEVQALRLSSTENNPQLEVAESELAGLQGEVTRLEQRNHSSGFSNLGLEDVPGAGLDYLRAERNLQYRETLYEMLLKQYDAAKLDQAKDSTIIQVVEPAIMPDRRSSPKRLVILLASTFVGFFLGCFLALLSWWAKMLQSDPETAGRMTDLKRALTQWGNRKAARAR
ncbi:MAG: GNVR domain-containing protein [Acidobacteriaceae bacterium]